MAWQPLVGQQRSEGKAWQTRGHQCSHWHGWLEGSVQPSGAGATAQPRLRLPEHEAHPAAVPGAPGTVPELSGPCRTPAMSSGWWGLNCARTSQACQRPEWGWLGQMAVAG